MRYPANVYLTLAFLFFGAFVGCCACIAAGTISRRNYFTFRRPLALLLLAAAAVFFALVFFEARRQMWGANFVFETAARRFPALFLYAALGAVCTAFLRSVFPLVSALYVLFTFSFGIALYRRLPQPQDFMLTVDETFVRDESSGTEYEFFQGNAFAENDAERGVTFFVYEINENALFPLPHVWYEIAGAVVRNASGEFPHIPSGRFSARKRFATDSSDNFCKKLFWRMCDALVDDARVEVFALPRQQQFPALYNVDVQTDRSNFRVVFEKVM